MTYSMTVAYGVNEMEPWWPEKPLVAPSSPPTYIQLPIETGRKERVPLYGLLMLIQKWGNEGKRQAADDLLEFVITELKKVGR
jgi:hypothetical protein